MFYYCSIIADVINKVEIERDEKGKWKYDKKQVSKKYSNGFARIYYDDWNENNGLGSYSQGKWAEWFHGTGRGDCGQSENSAGLCECG